MIARRAETPRRLNRETRWPESRSLGNSVRQGALAAASAQSFPPPRRTWPAAGQLFAVKRALPYAAAAAVVVVVVGSGSKRRRDEAARRTRTARYTAPVRVLLFSYGRRRAGGGRLCGCTFGRGTCRPPPPRTLVSVRCFGSAPYGAAAVQSAGNAMSSVWRVNVIPSPTHYHFFFFFIRPFWSLGEFSLKHFVRSIWTSVNIYSAFKKLKKKSLPTQLATTHLLLFFFFPLGVYF